MKEIQLTQGQVALVDDADFDWLNQWKWRTIKENNSRTFYAIRREGIKHIKMHRLILGITNPDIKTDHKDHNGLNNQRSNLRTATQAQNCRNKSSHKNSTSNYLGVSWHKVTNKWRAVIYNGGKQTHLGLFETEQAAAMAYNNVVVKFYGEFANINILKNKEE